MTSYTRRHILLLCFVIEALTNVSGFILDRRSSCRFQSDRIGAGRVLFATSQSEFSVVDEEEEFVSLGSNPGATNNEIFIKAATSPVEPSTTSEESITSEEPTEPSSTGAKQRPEYGALSTGTVVKVQVGDLALARKAWKKRRRTGSPLLVPCSVLNVDRQSMVRWNLIHLLEKFGRSQKDGIELTSAEMAKHYRYFLKSSLTQQASALGFETINEMLPALFNKKAEEFYGVRLVERNHDDQISLSLKAPISRHKAHKLSSKSPLLQFRLPRKGDHGDADTLTHTGYVRVRDDSEEARPYTFLPLSAALRVSQKDDVDTGRVEEGSIHPAVVFDYDMAGDGGSPLLTLSLNPGGARESMKVKPDRKYTPIEHPQHMLNELKVGNGPFNAKVVQILPGKALVDCEVGHKISAEGMVKIFGTLRFEDCVEVPMVDEGDMPMEDEDDGSFDVIESALEDLDEEDEEWDEEDDEDDGVEDEEDDEEEWEEDDDSNDDSGSLAEDLLSLREDGSFEDGTFEEGEEDEDITDLFVMNEDGSLSYTDPETGEIIVIDADDEDFGDMSAVKDAMDDFKVRHDGKGFAKEDTTKAKKTESKTKDVVAAVLAPKPKQALLINTKLRSKRLRVGDDIQIYVRSVSKRSGQFTVSTNPAVQGRTAKDLNIENDVQKKLQRLEKKLGGSLKRIRELEGQECEGTVRATSKTGDWLYVQPSLKGLPVGVATLEANTETFVVGDTVRIRLTGLDEQRGQLAMQVLSKLAP